MERITINNSKTIISQRSISILGVLIVSIFIVLAMAMYYRSMDTLKKIIILQSHI